MKKRFVEGRAYYPGIAPPGTRFRFLSKPARHYFIGTAGNLVRVENATPQNLGLARFVDRG
jgi:hypothetical protein